MSVLMAENDGEETEADEAGEETEDDENEADE